jgi:hypothetical protein
MNLLAKYLSFRLSFRSTRILRQIVIITPLFTGLLPHAMTIRRLYDEWTTERHLWYYVGELGTTPLKIIYAGRLEYACVCVCLQVLRGKDTCGERRKGSPSMNSFDYWKKVTLFFIYLSGTASHGRWTASQSFKILKSRKLFIASESKSLFSCPE